MKDRYVVDTNILIAASAAHPENHSDIDATPGDPELRLQVWQWLDKFQDSESRMILDYDGRIWREYLHKLTEQDFGILVVLDKLSRSAVDHVKIDFDPNGHAVLPPTLEPIIHDREDRKMVAAACAAHAAYGSACIAFAGDTDWHDWEEALAKHHVMLEPVIEEWSRKKHQQKKGKKARTP